jgi:hypothetical protein
LKPLSFRSRIAGNSTLEAVTMLDEKGVPWPYYKAHHVIQAVEIVSIKPDGQGVARAETKPAMSPPLGMPKEFIEKYRPTVGAFIVEDADGDFSCIEHKKFLDCFNPVGVKQPVDVEKLQRDLEKAEKEAADWRIRYEDLQDGVRRLLE